MLKKTELKKTFFKKKILITGHTGFKGSWLVALLNNFESDIYGISDQNFKNQLNYNFVKSKIKKEFFFDLSDYKKTKKTINLIKPDIIFHFAAQALVLTSYKYPMNTFQNNFNATISILETLRNYRSKLTAIFITSDKVYKNEDKYQSFVETDYLKGDDPYSASKVAVEMALHSYFKFFIKKKNLSFAVTRAGNVIGGGDWANDRIIPDAYKSWFKNKSLVIRNPNATRPWQHVLEPLYGYLFLAFYLNKNKKINGEIFNFGPSKLNNTNVYNIISILASKWSSKKIIIKKKNKNFFEHKLLSLNSKKALRILGWRTILSINETCLLIHDWYYNFYTNKNNSKKMASLIDDQIKYYERKIFKK